jgi:O-antigen biosynthesis protein WbqP
MESSTRSSYERQKLEQAASVAIPYGPAVTSGGPGSLVRRRRGPRRPGSARPLSLLVKRGLDIVIALFLLVVLSPLIALVWRHTSRTFPGKVIYWSRRVGRHGRLFNMPKFRTMYEGVKTCPREELLSSDACLAPLGRFLRLRGIDELPQLLCVVTGEMSLIGPRPLLASDPATKERSNFPEALEIAPGITGLAQVTGRNSLTPRRKARLDAFYARSFSLPLDFWLLILTIEVVRSGKGFM